MRRQHARLCEPPLRVRIRSLRAEQYREKLRKGNCLSLLSFHYSDPHPSAVKSCPPDTAKDPERVKSSEVPKEPSDANISSGGHDLKAEG